MQQQPKDSDNSRAYEPYYTYILRKTRECNNAEKTGEVDRQHLRGPLRSNDLDEEA